MNNEQLTEYLEAFELPNFTHVSREDYIEYFKKLHTCGESDEDIQNSLSDVEERERGYKEYQIICFVDAIVTKIASDTDVHRYELG